jgi:hypothetical protein
VGVEIKRRCVPWEVIFKLPVGRALLPLVELGVMNACARVSAGIGHLHGLGLNVGPDRGQINGEMLNR